MADQRRSERWPHMEFERELEMTPEIKLPEEL